MLRFFNSLLFLFFETPTCSIFNQLPISERVASPTDQSNFVQVGNYLYFSLRFGALRTAPLLPSIRFQLRREVFEPFFASFLINESTHADAGGGRPFWYFPLRRRGHWILGRNILGPLRNNQKGEKGNWWNTIKKWLPAATTISGHFMEAAAFHLGRQAHSCRPFTGHLDIAIHFHSDRFHRRNETKRCIFSCWALDSKYTAHN